MQKKLKIYIDKNGKIINNYEEINKTNNEIKETFPMDEKPNNFFIHMLLVLAAGQIASKTITPIIQRTSLELGNLLLSKKVKIGKNEDNIINLFSKFANSEFRLDITDQKDLQNKLGTIGKNMPVLNESIFMRSLKEAPDTSLYNIANSVVKRFVPDGLKQNDALKMLFSSFSSYGVKSALGGFVQYNTIQSITGQEKEDNFLNFWIFKSVLYSASYGTDSTLSYLNVFNKTAKLSEIINISKSNLFITIGQFGKAISESFSKNFTDSLGEDAYTIEAKTKKFGKDFSDFFKIEKEKRFREKNQLQYYTAYQLEQYIDILNTHDTTFKEERIEQAEAFFTDLFSKNPDYRKKDFEDIKANIGFKSPMYEHEFQALLNRSDSIGLDEQTKADLERILSKLRAFTKPDQSDYLEINGKIKEQISETSIFPHLAFNANSFNTDPQKSVMYLTKDSTLLKLHNISNFQKSFKIPYLFNPLSVFQIKFFEQLETKEFFSVLDEMDVFKNKTVKEYIVDSMLKDEKFVESFRNYIKSERALQMENYNRSELFGFLKQDQPAFAIKIYSKDTKNFLANFMETSSSPDIDAIYANQLKKENGDLISEKLVFRELLLKQQNIKKEKFLNTKAVISNGTVSFEQILNIFKDDNQQEKLDFDKIQKNFQFGNTKFDQKLHYSLKVNDQYYYQIEKTKLGQTLTRIADQQYGNIKLITNRKVKKDLPFNQQYSFTPNKWEEIKELFTFMSKNNVIKKELKVIAASEDKAPKNAKTIQKLMQVTNGQYLNEQTLSTIFKIEIDRSNIELFTEEYIDQFEFFQDIHENLFKVQMNQHDREFFLNLIPASQALEVDIYRSVKNSKVFSAIDLQTQVTQLGETKGDLMYKVVQMKKIFDLDTNAMDEVQSIRNDDIQTYQYLMFNNILKRTDNILNKHNLRSKEGRINQSQEFANFKIEDGDQIPIAKAVTNRLKRLDLITRIIENEKTDKIEEKLRFKTSRSNQIVFSSVSKSEKGAQNFFLNKKGESTQSSLLFHYVVDRPVQLLEEWFLGRPNPEETFNQFQSLKQVAIKRILPVQGVITAFKQFDQFLTQDDETEQPIYVPTKLLSETYTSFMQGLLKISEVTQVTKVLTELSKSFPHILSTTTQDISQYLTTSGDMFLLQGAASYLEDIPDQEKYQLEATGNKNVPVKQARWWEMGRTPFQGGKTLYFRPHQQYLAGSQWEFTDTLYGSKQEYLEYQSLFPTPFNQFGIKPIFNPNYFLEKHQLDRPYPYNDNSNLSYIPFVGPLQGGIQKIIAPDNEHQFLQETEQQITINDFNFNIDQSMKVPLSDQSALSSIKNKQLVLSGEKTERKNELIEAISKEKKHQEDYLGMLGFFGSLSNIENKEHKKVLADPDLMLGNRLYYQRELGSMFGQTEYFRRFVNNYYGKYGSKYYNPIPNAKFITEYNWLPKEYYIDFFHGDVYSSVPYGEVRLPGQAYERTHELIDNYGKIDQFKIIQNVAPYSRSYAMRKTKLLKEIDSYNDSNKYHITTAIQEGDEVRKKIRNYDYPLSEDLTDKTVFIKSINDDGTLEQTNEKVPVRIAGPSLDINIVAKHIFETETVNSIDEAYVEAENRIHQLKGMIGDKLSGYVQKDKNKQYTMDESGNVYLELINKPIQSKAKQLNLPIKDENNWQDYQQYYRFETPVLNTVQQIQEIKSHLYNFKNEKFGGNFSQIESYERYNVFGKQSQSWDSPVSDFLKPMFFNNMNINPLYATAKGIGLGIMSGTNLESKTVQQFTTGSLNLTTSLMGFINPMLPKETTDRYDLEEKYLYQKKQRGERNLFSQQKYQKTPKELISFIPGAEQDYLPLFVNSSKQETERIKEIQPSYTKFALEQLQEYKENKINGIDTDLVDRTELVQYQNTLSNKFDGTIKDYYIDPNINLELLYAREVYSRFDDTSKFDAYQQNIQKQYYSLLNYPLKNSYYSQMKQNGIDIRFYRNQTNGAINPYINVSQNNGTYTY